MNSRSPVDRARLSHLEVDISSLVDETSQINVADMTIPEGVKVENDPETPMASVSIPREDEPEETEPLEVDMDAVEVEQKGSDDTETSDDADADKE